MICVFRATFVTKVVYILKDKYSVWAHKLYHQTMHIKTFITAFTSLKVQVFWAQINRFYVKYLFEFKKLFF